MPTINKVYPKAICPICNTEFDLTRKDKKHCSKKCQTNSSRASRKIADSPYHKRIHETFDGSYSNLANNFYETPHAYKVEFMERLLQEGRRLVAVRRILKRTVPFGGRGRLPIQQIFHHYCRETYGVTVREALDRSKPLPTDTIYPCEYYGPFQEPLYSDGTYLKRSEQPFVSRRGKITKKLSTGKPYDWAAVAFNLSSNQEKRKAGRYVSSPELRKLLAKWSDPHEDDLIEKLYLNKMAA